MKSIVNINKLITSTQWVVSLVTKPQGKIPEHAFLVVEGLSQDEKTILYRRYDYVPGEEILEATVGQVGYYLNQVKRYKGKIVIREHVCSNEPDDQKRFFWTNVMKDLRGKQGCQGLSWEISLDEVLMLHNYAKADEADPPDYQISGAHALFAASSALKGHNCFTWVRTKLYQIKKPTITNDPDLKLSWSDFLAGRASKHIPLTDPTVEEEASRAKCVMM